MRSVLPGPARYFQKVCLTINLAKLLVDGLSLHLLKSVLEGTYRGTVSQLISTKNSQKNSVIASQRVAKKRVPAKTDEFVLVEVVHVSQTPLCQPRNDNLVPGGFMQCESVPVIDS